MTGQNERKKNEKFRVFRKLLRNFRFEHGQ